MDWKLAGPSSMRQDGWMTQKKASSDPLSSTRHSIATTKPVGCLSSLRLHSSAKSLKDGREEEPSSSSPIKEEKNMEAVCSPDLFSSPHNSQKRFRPL